MTTYEHETGGLYSSLVRLVEALRTRVLNTVELAAAEVRLAAMAGVTMLLLVILAAACIVVAWGFLMLALAVVVVNAGLSWPVVALALAVAHLAGAGALLWWAMRLSRHLTLPALRESLALGDRERPDGR